MARNVAWGKWLAKSLVSEGRVLSDGFSGFHEGGTEVVETRFRERGRVVRGTEMSESVKMSRRKRESVRSSGVHPHSFNKRY